MISRWTPEYLKQQLFGLRLEFIGIGPLVYILLESREGFYIRNGNHCLR